MISSPVMVGDRARSTMTGRLSPEVESLGDETHLPVGSDSRRSGSAGTRASGFLEADSHVVLVAVISESGENRNDQIHPFLLSMVDPAMV
jgi:hypothetical protein